MLREEEGLFSRGDFDGQLVRMDKVTADDFAKQVTIKIDGRDVTVPKAVPAPMPKAPSSATATGSPTPRATTIYDAASELFVKSMGDRNPIPILCHQEHMNPVAVCRVCTVEIAKVKRGQMQRERKLLPACQHRVEDTMDAPARSNYSPDQGARDRIGSAVRTLTELLVTDHLTAAQVSELGTAKGHATGDVAAHRGNELIALAERLGIGATRFPRSTSNGASICRRGPSPSIPKPASCAIAASGCDDVKKNFIIGRTGKGYTTHIGFDLNDPMGDSEIACRAANASLVARPTP